MSIITKQEYKKIREKIDKHIEALVKDLNKGKKEFQKIDKDFVINLLKIYIETYEKTK
jgi:hypothetical protein